MTESEQAAGAAKQAAEALGITQLVPTIYADMLQPAAREVGQQLVVVARAVGIALAPLRAAVWGYDRISDYLAAAVAAKLAAKPVDEIQAPDPVVAGPAVLNMAFAGDAPRLREMYANLLAHAMHSPSAPKAHPSFAHVIQQLTASEARILERIAGAHRAEAVLFEETVVGGPSKGDDVDGPYISTQWSAFCTKSDVASDVADVAYHNFIRLGLLIERTEVDSSRTVPLTWVDNPEPARTINFVMLTPYGSQFLDVCVRDV